MLKAERDSDRFVVDNTPPVITELSAQARVRAGDPTVRLPRQDTTSAIVRAQYSLDAGDWMMVRPTAI